MINNYNSLNKNTENIKKEEQKEQILIQENKDINQPMDKSDSLEEINEEEDFYPIMSRIKRDLKEKKKKKLIINEKHKITNKIKINLGNKPIKLPFMKLSNKSMNSHKLDTLLTLEPFHTDFNTFSEKKGEDILKIISEEYSEENYRENNIIYRYGDEAENFYIINEGNISLFFPFTEIVNMNIDEFYIYILRLRRYNEIEMLNEVLLLNQGKFMIDFDESFDIDEYILKLYNTSLKLKYDSTFIYKNDKNNHNKNNDTKKKIQKLKIKTNKNQSAKPRKKSIRYSIGSFSTRKQSDYRITESDEFDENKFKIFYDKDIKEVVLRIEEEIIETMKWIMPDKLYYKYEKKVDDRKIKKIIKFHNDLIQQYKEYNSNAINDKEYHKRIYPPIIYNKNLEKKEMIIMKYLHLYTISKGYYFGDFCSDSLTLFCPKYLNLAKNSRLPLKIHNFFLFRNMTVISNTNNTCLLSFNKKTFFTYISKFIENKTSSKKKFLIYNPLFAKTTNQNLLRTYSICFKEQNIKEGEIIVKENDTLNESNIYLYFIKQGEFQAYCKKTIYQMDEIIKLLGKEDHLIDTFPKNLHNLIGTKYYNDLINKVLNLKLNFLTKNDIIGLSEVFEGDKYFNNVICTNSNTKVYTVDMRIVKLLVDSDEIILNNKNAIIFHKYEILADILLKKRKIYFDSFFSLEKHNIDINKSNQEKDFVDTDKDNTIDNNKNNSKEFLGENFTQSIIGKNKNNCTSIRTIQKFKEIQSSTFEEKINQMPNNNQQIIKNIKMSNNPFQKIKTKPKLIRNLGDLDRMLANLNGNFTLSDKRLERSMEFRKKYFKKMEKMEQEKKFKEKERQIRLESQTRLRRCESNIKLKGFQKSLNIYKNMFKVLPLLPDKDNNIKSDGQYKYIIPYRVQIFKKSVSANTINPLAYDDFNRYYNTTQYFRFNHYKNKRKDFFEEKKMDQKKEYFEYNIEFKSDLKFKNKKDNKLMRNNLLTQKLRKIYKGKLDRILNKK